MLPKRRRLSAAEVSEVLARGKSVRGTLLSVKYVVAQGLFRVAVVAPKSLARKATQRNRLRRALYAALESLPEGTSFPSSKTVFFVRALPHPPMVPSLREELSLLAKKLP